MTSAFSLSLSPQRTIPWKELFVAGIDRGWICALARSWSVANMTSNISDANLAKCECESCIGEFIQSTLNGDGSAYQKIVIHYQKMISGRMWKFTRDPTMHEELVQDVFVEAFFSLNSYRGKAPFEHWLQTIATRIGYRFWKSRRSSVRLTDEQLGSLVSRDANQEQSSEEAGELVHYLLEQLSDADRLVLTLISLEGCSIAEAARLTGWNQTLVKVRAYRARLKLEAIWKRIESRAVRGKK